MRFAIAIATFALGLVLGCSSSPGGTDLAAASDFGSGDLSAPDLGGVDLGGVDLGGADLGRSCMASCSRCATGVCCGAGCCNAGEWCDNGTCRCGDPPSPACSPGMMCVSNVATQNGCGHICCGNGVTCPP
jgi:hypothetical protein